MNKIGLGAVVAVLGLVGSGYAWDYSHREATHTALSAEVDASAITIAGDIQVEKIELSLQQIELELKLYRAIAESRELTPDEKARKQYLEQYREVLLAQQLKQVS